jgi:hypothetical protein
VPRSELVRQAERDLELFSLLAVPLNAHARLETTAFRAEAARLLRLPVFKLSGTALGVPFNNREIPT